MFELIVFAAVIALVYCLAAFGKVSPPKPVVIPSPVRKQRRLDR